MSPILALLKSRKFLLAVLAAVQTILFQFVPNFPQEVWISINAIIVAVILGITVEDAAEKSATINYFSNDTKPVEDVDPKAEG